MTVMFPTPPLSADLTHETRVKLPELKRHAAEGEEAPYLSVRASWKNATLLRKIGLLVP
ncbi:hypothetical protein EYF80_066824 [Liparis tanakae]|uniref:Uncharacterized protein n=1 Tax=Liparis tanakae TaxID=230148 RepID=A0A4Z2E2X0_9TELE|nr:hypothetical protein EYF80_066824 [Liparis tanakae]